ncbi:hypothetical protein K9N68_21935 [Kovacikia minuta CCNUW1]|uniref:hypothetical protein n=1 Tax=Kovacikia minuta TaxID=2931930 RepID=UPI001CCF6C66|nr:hypothetical protein [Kovacikia minuta]UBF24352.1 hypothetical protein K9N68_21935 [Kovacikia minuta CCNUW1]
MLTAKRRLKLEGIFAPRSPLEFVGFALISGMLGLLSSGNLIGLVFVPLFAIVWWVFDHWRSKKLVATASYSITKEQPCPAKGLLLLLSAYDPRTANLKNPKVLQPLVEQILHTDTLTEADFAAINLLGSNLLPQIRAVEYHVQRGKLRDVWFIATETYDTVKGSDVAAAILEKYLRFQYGIQRFDIHRSPELTVREYDYVRLCRIVENVFRHSGYRDEMILADITGGNKMMSVAIAMACIPPGRRMQYMDTPRNRHGNPLRQGEMVPVVIDIDPILYPSDK